MNRIENVYIVKNGKKVRRQKYTPVLIINYLPLWIILFCPYKWCKQIIINWHSYVVIFFLSYVATAVTFLCVSPGLLCSNFLSIILLSSAQKVTYYVQYYAHNYCNYATAVLILSCQSLIAKRASFISQIVTHSPNIIISSESWLKPSIKDHEIFPTGYTIHHHDHVDGYGDVLL